MARTNSMRVPYAQAGVAITNTYVFVKLDTAGKFIPCASAADIPDGVVITTGAKDRAIAVDQIQTSALIKVKAGAAIAGGASVGTNASGELVTKSTSGDHAVGKALGAIKDNEIGEVLVGIHRIA